MSEKCAIWGMMILLGAGLPCSGQDMKKDSLQHRWSVGFSGSMDHHLYSFFQPQKDDAFGLEYYYLSPRNTYYSFGVFASFAMSQKFIATTGALFSEHGYNMTYHNPYPKPPTIEYTPLHIHVSSHQLGIPLKIQYIPSPVKKINPTFFIGAIPAHEIISRNVYIDKKFSFSIIWGFGVAYHANKYFLSLESSYAYYLSNPFWKLSTNAGTISTRFSIGYKY